MRTASSFLKTFFLILPLFSLLSLQAPAADDEGIPDGIYHIKNLFLRSEGNPCSGLLACAMEATSSGVYDGEILDGKADKDIYLFREGYRDSLLWDVRSVQHEGTTCYTIRNCAHRGGFLTLSNDEARFYGYWCQVVSGEESEAHKTGQWAKSAVEFLPYGKGVTLGTGWLGQRLFGTETLTEGVVKTTESAWLFKGGQENYETRYPLTVLWAISKAEDGAYTLKNRGEEVGQSALGILSCATALLPGQKRALVLHHFPGINYTEEHKGGYGAGGSSRPQVLWELSFKAIVEGSYLISHSSGTLSRSAVASGSGYYVEVLTGENPGDMAVWEIQKADDEGGLYYTIRNCACSGEGWLTWAREKTSTGYRLQVLADNKQYLYNAYPGNKARYEPNGGYRRDILWKITPVGGGKFILKNVGSAGLGQLDSGILGCGGDASSGGQAQVFWNAPENGGDPVIWELKAEKGENSYGPLSGAVTKPEVQGAALRE